MICPDCGYYLSAFDLKCPRCEQFGSAAKRPPTKEKTPELPPTPMSSSPSTSLVRTGNVQKPLLPLQRPPSPRPLRTREQVQAEERTVERLLAIAVGIVWGIVWTTVHFHDWGLISHMKDFIGTGIWWVVWFMIGSVNIICLPLCVFLSLCGFGEIQNRKSGWKLLAGLNLFAFFAWVLLKWFVDGVTAFLFLTVAGFLAYGVVFGLAVCYESRYVRRVNEMMDDVSDIADWHRRHP